MSCSMAMSCVLALKRGEADMLGAEEEEVVVGTVRWWDCWRWGRVVEGFAMAIFFSLGLLSLGWVVCLKCVSFMRDGLVFECKPGGFWWCVVMSQMYLAEATLAKRS